MCFSLFFSRFIFVWRSAMFGAIVKASTSSVGWVHPPHGPSSYTISTVDYERVKYDLWLTKTSHHLTWKRDCIASVLSHFMWIRMQTTPLWMRKTIFFFFLLSYPHHFYFSFSFTSVSCQSALMYLHYSVGWVWVWAWVWLFAIRFSAILNIIDSCKRTLIIFLLPCDL